MSSINSTISKIYKQLEELQGRVNGTTTPSGRPKRSSSVTREHDHSDALQGGIPDYDPASFSSWNGNQDPGNLWQALDQLASRLRAIELQIQPITSYAPSTMLFAGMEA